jgi:enoyl-CoA hydratase/carnithine racemase
VDAQEAARIGLADDVVPPDRTLDCARELARTFAAGPALALRAAKLTVDEGLDLPLESGLALERSHFLALFGTEDKGIGMSSFREHGPGKANFVGR